MKIKSDKRYRIQVVVSGNTLTFNNCKILSETENWLEFSDKFNTTYRYNKNIVTCIEELKNGK